MSVSVTNQAPFPVIKLAGTPTEIGAQLWARMCNPAIRATANAQAPEVLYGMYAGLISAALGSLAADFGHDGALELAQKLVAQFDGMKGDMLGVSRQ